MSTLEVSNLNDGTTTVATTNLTNGSAKHWVRYNQSTPAINSSFNTSSVEDTSTGKITANISSAFSSTTNYCTSGSKDATTLNFTISPINASSYNGYQRNDAGTYQDATAFSFQAVGELA